MILAIKSQAGTNEKVFQMSKPNPLVGISLMLLATAFFASKDGLAKTFLDQVGPFQTIWIQFSGAFFIMALVCVPKYGLRVFLPKPIGGQFVRGALNATAIATLYWALTYIPLADGIAMFMIAPAVVTLLSPFLLGEKVGPLRMLAVAVGFCGVLVILKPGFGGNSHGYYIGIVSGFLMGLYLIANRRLAASQPPLLNVTHNALMGALTLTPFLPLFWSPIPGPVYIKLSVLVVLAVIGQALMISSFVFAPAAVLAPYSYAMLVFAALIGYVFLGSVLDNMTWIGIVMIIGSGIFIALREQQLAKKAKIER